MFLTWPKTKSWGWYLGNEWCHYLTNTIIYNIIKTTRLSVVSVTAGVVNTHLAAATMSGRGARVSTCTCVHDNIPCRTVDVYRSRPIGASLITTSPRQGCLALKGLHTGAGKAWWQYPCGLNWGLSSTNILTQETIPILILIPTLTSRLK